VESVPGRNGGARLARNPEQLSMLEIIEAVDGPVALTRCVIRPGACPRDAYCVVHGFWKKAQTCLVNVLSDTKISAFCGGADGDPVSGDGSASSGD
jgi:Rrf2 family protein